MVIPSGMFSTSLCQDSSSSASMKAARGWIDIGKKDMLFRGTKFRITNPAGTKVKGFGEVINLKQDRAEVGIY